MPTNNEEVLKQVLRRLVEACYEPAVYEDLTELRAARREAYLILDQIKREERIPHTVFNCPVCGTETCQGPKKGFSPREVTP
jgi:hypothetical protein